jgi:hypothetical protein
MKTPALYGITINRTGANLPAEDGPWQEVGALISLGETTTERSPEIAEDVKRSGYALLKGATVWRGTD